MRLQVLGTLDVVDGDGVQLPILAQPKRLAVLLYLALARPRGKHRRDTLLAMFWPELDRERARTALNKSVHHLRSVLGAEVVIRPGAQRLGVDEVFVESDAARFESAIGVDPALALELYRGELLPGFNVSDAPEFERWLDQERARLHQAAVGAAWSLAESAEVGGDAAGAERWGRRAVALDPLSESATRRLMGLLGPAGNRAGAVRAFRELRTRLSRELGLEPSPQTMALLAELSATTLGFARDAGSSPSVGARVGPPAGDSIPGVRLAPFQGFGEPSGKEISAHLEHLLAARIEALGHPRLVTTETGDASRIEGHVAAFGDSVQTVLEIWHDGATQPLRIVAEGHAAALVSLADELARSVFTASCGEPERLRRAAAESAPSLGALAAYLRGDAALRSCRFSQAVEALEEALLEAPEFAIAAYRLSSARAWRLDEAGAAEAARQAVDASGQLSGRNRKLLAANLALREGKPAAAERTCRAVLHGAPDDVEALHLLGKVLAAHHVSDGADVAETREAFDRVVAGQPDNVEALLQLARIAAFSGDEPGLSAVLERIPGGSAGEKDLELEVLHGYTTRSEEGVPRVISRLRKASTLELTLAIANLADHTDLPRDPDAVERLIRLLTEPPHDSLARAWGHVCLAHLYAATGSADRATADLGAAARHHPPTSLVFRANFSLLPASGAGEDEIRGLISELERWNAPGEPVVRDVVLTSQSRAYPAIRLYLIGMLRVRMGDGSGAAASVQALRGLADSGAGRTDDALPPALADAVEAFALAATGRPKDAIERLDRCLEVEFGRTAVNNSPFHFRLHERYLLARLLHEEARPADALAAYRRFSGQCYHNVLYRGLADLGVAEILESSGDAAGAAGRRSRADRWWADPLVRASMRRIARAPVQRMLAVDRALTSRSAAPARAARESAHAGS